MPRRSKPVVSFAGIAPEHSDNSRQRHSPKGENMADERVLRLVLRDHLSRDLSSLRNADPKRDVPFMAEVAGEATLVWHPDGVA